ncbi:MAG: hypothetical protein HOH47_02790, partial [Flavobacteriaceae bacterium]|nr:hypothetical protein [Flavobacteriaceae bacterium]
MHRLILFSIFLVIFSIPVIAQDSEPQTDPSGERLLNISEFVNLKVYSGIEVKLIPSDENKLLISGADRMDVIAKIKGQTLKIRHTLE